MKTELAILIPVLQRPHRVRPVLRSIFATTKADVIFITDPGDEDEQRVVRTMADVFDGVSEMVVKGNYARKINRAVAETETPLLFFGADDLKFHKGWLEHAKAKLTEGIGVVATNDLCNKMVMVGDLATHPLVTREYTELGTVDNPDMVLHEGYRHEYVDREFSETAKYRGAFAYAPKSIVEHLHPMVGKAPNDYLYRQMPIRMRQGRRVYNRRRRLWVEKQSA